MAQEVVEIIYRMTDEVTPGLEKIKRETNDLQKGTGLNSLESRLSNLGKNSGLSGLENKISAIGNGTGINNLDSKVSSAGAKIDALQAKANALGRGATLGGLDTRVSNTGKQVDDLGRKVDNSKNKFNNLNNTSLRGIGSSIMRLGALIGVSMGAREIINVTAEFQKQQAVLSTMFGDTQGEAYFQNLKKQSEKLPASMAEITESFVKLNGIGINASNADLTALSDLASAAGKNILDAAGAMQGAATGEFERLKALNIVARVDGNKLTLMYKNQKTTIDNNTESIRKYMIGLGKMKGVAGSSTKIMGTMGGVMSNIGDSFSSIAFEIGKALLPTMKKLGEMVSWISGKMPTIIKFFEDWGFVIKPVLAGITAMFAIQKLIGIVNAFKIAWAALNSTMLLNPFVAIAAAIVACGVALYELQKRFGGFANLWKNLWENIKTGWTMVGMYFSDLWDRISTGYDVLKHQVLSITEELTGRIRLIFEAIQMGMQGNIAGAINNLKQLGSNFFNEQEGWLEKAKGERFGILWDNKIALDEQYEKYLASNKKMWDIWNQKIDPFSFKTIVPEGSQNGPVVPEPKVPMGDNLTELTASSNVKYVNVTVNKMIENLTFETTNLTESTSKIKDEVLKVLRETIADASSLQN